MTDLSRSRSPQGGKARENRKANQDALDVARAIASAAGQLGEDGLGREGLVGYFRKFAREQPNKFLPLLVRAIRDKLLKQLTRKADDEALRGRSADKTDLSEAVLLAAAQIGNDGLGKGGLAGYLFKYARTRPELYYPLLEMLIPYESLWAPEKPVPTREEFEKRTGFQSLFHGDVLDENGRLWDDVFDILLQDSSLLSIWKIGALRCDEAKRWS